MCRVLFQALYPENKTDGSPALMGLAYMIGGIELIDKQANENILKDPVWKGAVKK